MREIEPHVAGVAALHSPHTAVVDYPRVCAALAAEVEAAGGSVLLSSPVTALRQESDGVTLVAAGRTHRFDEVIACAGLSSDAVAAMLGAPDDLRIIPFRGEYFRLGPEPAALVRGLVYPVPDPRFPFLGVHLTRRIDGQVWAGPNAVLAFRRTGYRRRDVSIGDLAEAIANPGFRSLAHRLTEGAAFCGKIGGKIERRVVLARQH